MTDKTAVGATKSGPRSGASQGKTSTAVDPSVYTTMFVGAVLNMSWQLAIVVIVPIVGGHVLDGHFGTAPWLTLSGLAVAALGMVGVMWRTVREANAKMAVMQSKDAKGGQK